VTRSVRAKAQRGFSQGGPWGGLIRKIIVLIAAGGKALKKKVGAGRRRHHCIDFKTKMKTEGVEMRKVKND